MNLSDLIADIRDDLNRGSRLTEAQVRRKIRAALELSEQRNAWEYMDRYQAFGLNTAADEPRVLPMPNSGGVKKIEFIRLFPEDTRDRFKYLKEIDPRDIEDYDSGTPQGYFKDGMEFIWLDKTPDEDYDCEISFSGFTLWSDLDAFEPWPFKFQTGLIKHTAILLLGPTLRDESLMRMHATLLTDALKVAVDTDEDIRHSNSDMQMQYGG